MFQVIMLRFFTFVMSEFISECELLDNNVLSLYIRKDQNKVAEIFENLSHMYEDVLFREVDCNLCVCDNYDTHPKIVLTKDKETVDEHDLGFVEDEVQIKNEIEAFLHDNGFIKLNKEITADKGIVREMKLNDFRNVLIKPWLVLFYNDTNNVEFFDTISKLYINKINLGRVHKNEIANYEQVYNIHKYPTIIAFYDGLTYKFEDTMSLENLKQFADTLIEPVLPQLSYQDFLEHKNIKNTKFVIFYRNKNLAITYFHKLSQMYRFICKFYISNDPNLINHANISFTSKKKDVNPDEIIVLSAFRNNKFHHLKLTTFDFEYISNWIFHAHYPILTKITNQNFYRIFNGFKPVILLLTEGDKHNQDLETFAEKYHGNKVSTDFIFATLDVKEMHGFVDSLLPNFTVPGLVIHDPVRMLYYADKKILQQNFSSYLENLVSLYQNERLEPYPFKSKKSYIHYYIILALVLCVLAMCFTPKRNKKKQQ